MLLESLNIPLSKDIFPLFLVHINLCTVGSLCLGEAVDYTDSLLGIANSKPRVQYLRNSQ